MITTDEVIYSDPFMKAVHRTLEHEGVYSDDPLDRGGPTRYGITGPTLRYYNEHTGSDLKLDSLDKADAIKVYHEIFWINGGIRKIPVFYQDFVFDWVVHVGVSTAITRMQRVLGVRDDGIIGPATMIAFWNQGRILKKLVVSRMQHLLNIVEIDPTQGRFLKGWWRRVGSYL